MRSQQVLSTSKLYSKLAFMCGLAVLLLLSTMTSYGQDDPYVKTPERGFHPAGSYALSQIEHISTSSGNLMFNIPLASLPTGRGGNPGFNLRLQYNSKLYDTFQQTITDGYDPRTGKPNRVTLNYLSSDYEAGWKYPLFYKMELINRFNRWPDQQNQPSCQVIAGSEWDYEIRQDIAATYIYKLNMIFPDGSRHEFRPLGYQQYYDDGYYNINPYGLVNDCTGSHYIASTVMTYYSTDGTYARLDVYRAGGWALYFPDGSRVTPIKGGQRTYDRNNNYTDIIGITYNSHPATKIVDQLKRSIIIEYNSASNEDYIYAAGVAGEQLKTTIKWKRTYVFKTYKQTTASSTVRGNQYQQQWSAAFKVVDQIVLPAQADSLSYKFEYNGASADPWPNTSYGWGEISSITLPSGAKAAYSYAYDGADASTSEPLSPLFTEKNVLNNHPTKKDLTYLREYDGSSTPITETWHYNLTLLGGLVDFSSHTATITGPDGGITREYFYTTHPDNPLRGLSYKTVQPDGTVVERIWQESRSYGLEGKGINRYIKTEFTSVPDASGALVKTAIKDYSRDQNGNVTRIAEYDWVDYNSVTRGTYVPTGIPSGAPLKRVTINTYHNPTPDASDTTTDAPNAYYKSSSKTLHTAAASTEVQDTSQTFSRTELFYDDADTTGNLTKQVSWDSTKGSLTRPLTTVNSISLLSEYDSYGNRTLTTDARGIKTRFEYPSNKLYPNKTITGYTAADTSVQRTTTFLYDGSTGLVTKSTDVDNNISTSISYDVFGRPKLVKAADGKAEETDTQTIYDDVARRVIVRSDLTTKGDGKLVTIQHYDQLGRLRLSRQLENAATESETDETTGIKVQTRYLSDSTNSYQLVSNPYKAATSGGATGETTMGWTRSKRDNAGRVIEIKSFSGRLLPAPWGTNASTTGTVATTYDGIYTTVKDQMGKLRRSMLDGLGRLVRIDEPDATGDLGTPTAPEDPETNTNSGAAPSSFEEDAESVLGAVTAPKQQTVYSYDALSNLTGVTQGVQTRTFNYSSLSHLISAQNPESGTISYAYDADGNLHTKTDGRPVTITYEYDNLNRIKTRRYSNNSAPAVDYFYDGDGLTDAANFKGRLTRVVTQGVSTTSYGAYDALGRMLQSSQTTDAQTYTMNYRYDLAGHMIFQDYPSHKTVTTSYDGAGRISGLSGPSNQPPYLGSVIYTASGAMASMKLGNGLFEHTTFNSRLQPMQIGLGTASNNSSLLQLDYKYGALVNGALDAKQNNGNVQSQTITIKANGTTPGLTLVQSYSYDQLNRLSGCTETGGLSQTYKYDQFGNRAVTAGYVEDASLTPRSVGAYDAHTNQVTAWTYDAVGNLKQYPQHIYDYDGENRLVHSLSGTDTEVTYSYDGDGRRVKKVTLGGKTIFVYNVIGQLVAEYTNTSQTGDSGLSYVTADHLGSTRVITGSDKGVKARFDYLPFGEEIATNVDGRSAALGYTTDNVLRQKFTQKERDSETGLDYFGARYYANTQGRFTSVDPENAGANSRDPQNWNGYAYARNNPLLYTDPDGLLFRIRHADGTEEIVTDDQFNDIKNNPHNGELGIDVEGGTIYHTDDNGNLVASGTYERIWFDDLTEQANYAIWGVAARAPAMQKIILGFAAANLLPGVVATAGLAGGGITTLGLSGETGAAVTEGSLSSLSLQQLNNIIRGTQRQLLSELFGQGVPGAERALATGEVPAGLTRQTLLVAREIARRAVESGIKNKSGVQSLRLKIIEEALKKLGQ